MTSLKKEFAAFAQKLAAHLPYALATEFTLGVSALGSRNLGRVLGTWYSNNGYFKFPEGEVLVYRWPEVALVGGKGVAAERNTVIGQEHDPLRGDLYRVKTKDGAIERHYKWNVENKYKPA